MEERQKRSIAYRVGDTPRDRPSIHFKAGTGGIAFCLRCHGESKSSAGLRIDSREALVLGGELGVAIVPGRPDESLLMRAIARHESVSALPPEKEQALRPEQVAIEGRVHVHDLHATILHLLGLGNMDLIFKYKGRPERPTLNEGEAYKKIAA